MPINIDPKAWGKHYWFVLHTISFTYPENPNDTAKRKYYDLIQNLPLFLPNERISKQFVTILDKYPVKPYLDSRVMFVKWMHFVHNEINKIIGKEPLSYTNFLENMNYKLSTPIPASSTLYSDKNIIFGILIMFISILIYLDMRKKKV